MNRNVKHRKRKKKKERKKKTKEREEERNKRKGEREKISVAIAKYMTQMHIRIQMITINFPGMGLKFLNRLRKLERECGLRNETKRGRKEYSYPF